MNLFTQLVLIVGIMTPDHVQMLGTGFVVQNDGYIATTHHVAGSDDSNLVVLAPHIADINAFQNLSDNSCRPIAAKIQEIDPTRDLAILKAEFSWLSGNSSYKHLVDELCWRNIKRLGITNDTNKRISRMLSRNKFVSFVHSCHS